LLKGGLNLGGKAKDGHIKLSIGLKNNIPTSVRICKQVTEASENRALDKSYQSS